MNDHLDEARPKPASREDRLLRLLAVAGKLLEGQLFYTVSGQTRVRLPNGIECRLQDEETKDWLTALGYEQGLVVRNVDVKWMVRVLGNRARKQTSRTNDTPLSVIKILQQEPPFLVRNRSSEPARLGVAVGTSG